MERRLVVINLPLSFYIGAGGTAAAVAAVTLGLFTAYTRGYDKADTEIRAELAESANTALLEVNAAWERRLEVERERADFYREDAIRAQNALDMVRRETADDVREAIRGLTNAIPTAAVCELGPDFVRLHNTAAGYSDDPGTDATGD